TAATLLGDIQTDSTDAHIIKSVENQETKEHTANPAAPESHDNAASHDDATLNDSADHGADYVPTTHHNLQDDEHDGSGII
ncbi:MAG: hypothetical protein KAG18_05625, partial [Sinobacterium sp.]|nr:hypothetical protein [Sinobacterium sp.]